MIKWYKKLTTPEMISTDGRFTLVKKKRSYILKDKDLGREDEFATMKACKHEADMREKGWK